ncbi:SRPBCC family protein [Paraburkholderia sp. SUR17]|uniref:SRPBCC family protein n=1 Tax=Paraburkholderia sp. SUR17 TaxID=3034358 RepID=UPI002407F5CB|nr:SRPBCC family protein [Paraburkholderia sp. SUR17]WEY41759.1 SRPBCC family protein [Paraburkholderia sp. SUR17]
MAGSTFVYVTYIRTSPEALWEALTSPAFMKQYWFGMHIEAEWKAGASWKMLFPDGRVADTGEIVAFDPPKRLALRWRNEFRPELKEEGYSVCVMEIEPQLNAARLTVTHGMERDLPDSGFIKAVSGGWPRILSNLKSLLETGEVVAAVHPEVH